MDLSPTPSEQALRDEIRAWLRDHLPWEYGKGLPPRFDDLAEEVAFGREWQAKLASGRWVGVAWPEEYGGRGGGPVEHYIVTEELARARAPELVGRIGVNLVGPTLLAHGTDDAEGALAARRSSTRREIWCQLFSEPGAGSDLTSLHDARRRRSTAAGVLNGQKVWTSYAQFADWGWCLARTDPDVAEAARASPRSSSTCTRPGVEVRPLRQITDESEFNEVFFTDVFVPDDQLVGAERRRLARRELDAHPRAGRQPAPARHPRAARRRAAGASRSSAARSTTRASRRGSREAFVEVRLFQLHNWRSISRTAKGERPGPGRQHQQAVVERDEQAAARHRDGGARPDARRCGAAPTTTRATARGSGRGSTTRRRSIWAGTNEIQRNVIGERTLGSPARAAGLSTGREFAGGREPIRPCGPYPEA